MNLIFKCESLVEAGVQFPKSGWLSENCFQVAEYVIRAVAYATHTRSSHYTPTPSNHSEVGQLTPPRVRMDRQGSLHKNTRET